MVGEKVIKLKIASPEKVIVDKGVKSVLIPASGGPLLVLPRRAPYISSLEVGLVELHRFEDLENQIFYIEAGAVEIKNEVCSVLTENAVEITVENSSDYAEYLIEYKKQLEDAQTDSEKYLLSNRIEYIDMLLKAVNKKQN